MVKVRRRSVTIWEFSIHGGSEQVGSYEEAYEDEDTLPLGEVIQLESRTSPDAYEKD